MLTIRKLLEDKNCGLTNIKLQEQYQEVLDFPFFAGPFFQEVEVRREQNTSMDTALKELRQEYESVQGEIREIKRMDDKEHLQVDTILHLRTRKKDLKNRINERERELQIIQDVIQYKNCVYGVSDSQMSHVIPGWKDISFSYKSEMPFFIESLEQIQDAFVHKEKIAVEGGPCLFGEHEVDMNVELDDGECYSFDYSIGRNYQNETMEMADFLEKHSKEVKDITFVNHKAGVTTQEYDSMLYLFEIASLFRGRVVIPIPDMSYAKYLSNMLVDMEAGKREHILKKFRKISYQITDMYLKVIKKLKECYPETAVTVVHERDTSLCNTYYEKRKSYIERNHVLRKITAIPQKMESIKDYISMPALPYYLYGITNIIQVDCLDETDSYRKCRLAHKNDITLAAVLYPEILSDDGINTIFHTSLPYKKYMNEADYGTKDTEKLAF
ncbi:MAG: hypothetical protein PHE02_12015 [Lachnospiraceae bacterium]|nr:hypothetical protein [Lachnospiraceae bacterium]